MKTTYGASNWRSSLVLAIAALAAVGCGSTEPELNEKLQSNSSLVQCTPVDSLITVCGKVVDSNGNVLAGVSVELGGQTTVTAADGSFAIAVQRQRQVSFTLRAPGYLPFSTNLSQSVIGRTFALAPLFLQRLFEPGMANVVDPRTGAGVQLDPSWLMDAAGRPARLPVIVGVRYVDPARVAMPGDDGAITLDGRSVFLESFGTIYVEARDAAGQLLKLRPGMQAMVSIPVRADRLAAAPPSIPLWTQEPGSGTWNQQPSSAQLQRGQRPECSPTGGDQGGSCNPDDCSALSGSRFQGPTPELSFINADIEKEDPACLRIEVDASQLPAGTLPLCLDIKIPLPGGGTQTRVVCVNDGTNVLFNLPANVNLTISQNAMPGCPPPPSTSTSVNTGAPWGGTGLPSDPGMCNGVLTLPPLP